MREQELQQRIRAVLCHPQSGMRVWRNNVGAFTDSRGVLVRYGLAPGSSDLIGIAAVEVTPDMVGGIIGQFVAVEIKTPTGRVSEEQKAFLKTVGQFGGVDEIIRSVEQAEELVRKLNGRGNDAS